MAKNDEAIKLAALAKGMMGGDKKAMETFFECVDILEDKKLKKDGRLALTMVVGVVQLAAEACASCVRGGVGKGARWRRT